MLYTKEYRLSYPGGKLTTHMSKEDTQQNDGCYMHMTLGGDVKLRVILRSKLHGGGALSIQELSVSMLAALHLKGLIQDVAVVDPDTGMTMRLDDNFPLVYDIDDEVHTVKIHTPQWAEELPEDEATGLALGEDVRVQPTESSEWVPLAQVESLLTDDGPMRMLTGEARPYDALKLLPPLPGEPEIPHPRAHLHSVLLDHPCTVTCILETPDKRHRTVLKVRGVDF